MSLDRVLDCYRAINGDHPMTSTDDAYVRTHFVEVSGVSQLSRDQVLRLIADGRLPLPSYVLSDGTPMVHPDYFDPVRTAGSVDAVHDWFVGHWPDDERDVAQEEWDDGYLSGQYVCLWSVTPQTIKAKTAAIEAIKAETTALAAGLGSRERLALAVDRLEALELPFTGYDRLRFGGPTSRDVWIDETRRTYLDGPTGIRHDC